MKKSQINAILVDQTKRKNTIIGYSCIIAALIILAISFMLLYIDRNKNYTVSYQENSNIDYKVFLKDNPYFEGNYLGVDNQYLETLIDYIDSNFRYNISLNERNVDFKYSYRIDAKVEVKTKTGKNPVYKFTDTILEPVERLSNSNNVVSINEDVKIDYNYYNNLIKGFVSTYGLANIDSTLTVNMYVNVIGSCEDFEEDSSNESVMSLSIPLTTKTVDIDISDDLIENDDNVMVCKKNYDHTFIFIVLLIITLILLVLAVIRLIKYIVDTRSAEDIYHIELGKILNNYGSYIQEVVDGVNLKGYEVWKIREFNDMLEISDKVNQPILMVENSKKDGVYFVIPNVDKRLYLYSLKVSDIKKRMKQKNCELKFRRGGIDEI